MSVKGRSGYFITGVGTGIGKTVAAGAVAHLLKKSGYKTGVMKPVQTGARIAKGMPVSDDYEFLRQIAETDDPYEVAVPITLKEPLSPYHASLAEKQEVNIHLLEAGYQKLKERYEVVVVEGAGGLMVPLTESLFWHHFIKMIDLPLIVVTSSELGMIHQTLSTILSAEMYGLEIAGIMIMETNKKKHPEPDIEWLEKTAGYPVLGYLPFTSSVSGAKVNKKLFYSHVEKHIKAKPFSDFIDRKGSEAEWKRLKEADHKYVWHPFTQMTEWVKDETLVIESASGMKLKSVTGKEYYDGHSSYWVNVHGHGDPVLSRTLARENAKLDHATFLGLSNRPAIELAERLVEITPKGLDRVFYSDNGSTAVEVGMKMAVQYFRQREKGKSPKKRKFIALGEAYHGDTLGAVAVGGVEMYRKIFGPLLADVVFTPSPYCYRCPLKKNRSDCMLACATEMERIVEENHEEIAAFVIEPIVQGPGGIIVAPHGYLKRVREVCTKYDILLLADEVAVGFGRTGKMFACEHEDVEPDLMALSKSLGGGVVPIAATMATSEIYNAFLGSYEEKKTFFHGHTFTAHAPACAVALESLNLYRDKQIIRSIETRGQALADLLVRFENLPHVGNIRQKGMIVGIELVKDKETKEHFALSIRAGNMVSNEARRKGLIVRPLGDVLVLFPILAVGEEDLRSITNILYDSIATVTGSFIKNEPHL